MDKFKIEKNGNISSIDNYQIEEYFNNCDKKYTKFVAGIYDDKYVFTDISDHYSMAIEIEKNFGKFDFWTASAMNEFNIFAGYINEITANQIQMIIDSLLELKKYYLNSKKNKEINVISPIYEYLGKSNYSCDEIDILIDKLSILKKEIAKNVR